MGPQAKGRCPGERDIHADMPYASEHEHSVPIVRGAWGPETVRQQHIESNSNILYTKRIESQRLFGQKKKYKKKKQEKKTRKKQTIRPLFFLFRP